MIHLSNLLLITESASNIKYKGWCQCNQLSIVAAKFCNLATDLLVTKSKKKLLCSALQYSKSNLFLFPSQSTGAAAGWRIHHSAFCSELCPCVSNATVTKYTNNNRIGPAKRSFPINKLQ